ncbi:MAG: hypothetical protein IKL73_02380 [Lachnospiraceae bacterium]|nr:hypothetical protein [Lachnospiraceae bacterium]
MKKHLSILLVLVLLFSLTACKNDKKNGSITSGDEIYNKPNIEANEPTESDGTIKLTAIVTDINSSTKMMKLKAITIDKANKLEPSISGLQYDLSFAQASSIQDKHGTQITVSQIKLGEIVDIVYDSNSDYISKIAISDKAWEKKQVTGAEVNVYNNTISFAGSTYSYTDQTESFYKEEAEYIEDIGKYDVITLRGCSNTICSVVVEKSHGYLKLEGVTQFLDGYVSIGSSRVMIVKKDMLIEVTEGTHDIELSKAGITATKSVTIAKDATATLTFTEYLQDAAKKGTVEFTVAQPGVSLYVDGQKVDYTQGVTLAYGTHYLTIIANGYETVYDSFVVDKLTMSIQIDLDADI